jgi:hypothetical protein
MFDRVSEAAEKLATNVSRRAFMGRLGKGALTLAGAVGAFLAIPGLVQAGGKGCACQSGSFCCLYTCPNGSTLTTVSNLHGKCGCMATYNGCALSDGGCLCAPI